MIIFPAIDLRGGRVVRLRQGRADAETIYSDDPAQIAMRWQKEGAEWLHVVNLDGAFGEKSSTNEHELSRIITSVSTPVQFGGGLRDLNGIETVLALGVSRVIIGTAAVEKPALISDAIKKFGAERVAVGIDTRGGIVATHGWRQASEKSASNFAIQMRERGVTRIVYTDIVRDGMLHGIDASAIAELAHATGLRVIASGGVAGMNDIQALRAFPEIEGVIVGQALYTGALSLKEVISFQSSDFSRGESDE